MATQIIINSRVRIEKGCQAREVAKNTSAIVTEITELGAEYGHSVKVVLQFRNGFLAGKTRTFYARHINRLSDTIVNLNDGNPLHKIQISRAA